jgi:uncharacterized membrane protein
MNIVKIFNGIPGLRMFKLPELQKQLWRGVLWSLPLPITISVLLVVFQPEPSKDTFVNKSGIHPLVKTRDLLPSISIKIIKTTTERLQLK